MEASINDQSSLKESYVEIDKQLAGIEKERVAILGDGHCLPRAVFRGAKLKDLVAGHISYKSLFRSVIDSLKHEINDYKGFLEEDTATALRQLENYFVSKQYSLTSNVLDACNTFYHKTLGNLYLKSVSQQILGEKIREQKQCKGFGCIILRYRKSHRTDK